jgi:hypothetical protein
MTVLVEKLGPGLLTLGTGPLSVAQQLTGCKPVPLQVGGDEADKRMLASFTWRVVGDPTPTWA